MPLEHGCKILLFAGTTEGRQIAEYLNEHKPGACVSVATEYGKELLEKYHNIRVLSGRMDEDKIAVFLEEEKIGLVVDATHPFAVLVTENIKKACEREHVEYLRCLRESEEDSGEEDLRIVRVDSVAEAAGYLKTTEGKILIATGSKELELYTAIDNYQERCYARVLSVKESIDKTIALGFEGEHLIAMQGPFSREMNLALLKHVQADYFVTKDSGKTGGFLEKIMAAKEADVTLVVVGRPKEEGKSVEEICQYIGN